MKILCVGYRPPYPLRDGGNARSYGYLRELGRRHEVSYLCRADEPRPDAEGHLKTVCHSAEIFVDPFRFGWTDRLRAVAGGYPFGVIVPSDAFFRRFRDVLRHERFDLVYLVGVDTALLATDALSVAPVVWDVCDCTSRYYTRQARGATGVRVLWYRLQGRRYRRLEHRLLRRDLTVIVASPSEAEALAAGAGPRQSRLQVLPTGVGAAAPANPESGPPRLAFTGALSYPPNADAVRYFCREIFPRVRREHPDVRFELAGGGGSPELASACRAVDGVDFLGFVGDVSDVLGHATIFVCPMREGTGIKVKLLEAMACGLPVVASPLAVEGVPEARDGWNVRIAASADEFVGCLLELLRDARRRRELGARARELTRLYAWDRLGDRVDRLCRDEVARRRSGVR